MKTSHAGATLALAILLSTSSLAQFADKVLVPPPQEKMNANLYPADADAKAEIKAALVRAPRENKRILIEFGANWCLDCRILSHAFETDPQIRPLVGANYIVVHVDIGRSQPPKNSDLAKKYKVPLEKGIPALAVLDVKGKLLYSQQGGEFESARTMKTNKVVEFLEKWKPKARS